MVTDPMKTPSEVMFHGKQVLSEFDWTHCVTRLWANPETRKTKFSLAKHWVQWMESRNITGPINFEDVNQYLYEHRNSSMNMRKVTVKALIKAHPLIEYDLKAHAIVNQAFQKIRNVQNDVRIRQDMYMTSEEIDMILRHLYKADTIQSVRQACLFEALFQTAARCSELASIRHTDCKVFPDRVELNVIGKGSKQRTVFMTPLLYETICTHFGKVGWLLSKQDGGQMTRQGIKQSITRLTSKLFARQYKLSGRSLGPHSLRHSKAMEMKKRGVEVKKIQDYLGHSSPSTTIEYYFHDQVTAADVLS